MRLLGLPPEQPGQRDATYSHVALVQCASVAEAIEVLRGLVRHWPVCKTLALHVDLEAAGPADCINVETRIALWRAANRAWRIGVRTMGHGPVAENLLRNIDPYEARRAARKAARASQGGAT